MNRQRNRESEFPPTMTYSYSVRAISESRYGPIKITIVWTILVSWKLRFQWSVHFGRVGHINGKPRTHGTPAECYVYRKQDAHALALQRRGMCWNHIPLRMKINLLIG